MRARSRSGPRRLEVVVLIDGTGASWAVGVLDTTLRLAGRVVLAESPPTGLTTELSRTLSATAVGLARPEGATGAATVSFSIDLVRGEPQYLGSTPGLPRELALLEATTGIDLEARALHLTRGGHLKGEPPEARGHALQIFLSARDPEAGFAVRPGEVEALRLPAGAGLRADPEVEEGGFPAAEDPVLVRLTAHGASRNEALDRLHRALARTTVTLTGGATDKAFLSEVLDRLAVGTEPADPAWVERLVDSGEHLPRRGAEAALLAAAIAECEAELDGARERFLATAARGRPEIPNEGSSRFELGYRGWRYAFKVGSLEPLLYRVEVDGQTFDIQVGPPGRNGRSLTVGRRRYAVRTDLQGGDLLVEADGVPHRIARDRGVVVRSPSPALIVSVEVGPGDEVAAGEPLAVLEAMKMETSLTAPFAGRVRRVEVLPNTRVGGGGPLLVLEPLAPDPEPPGRQGPRVRFEPAMPAIPAIPAISAMSAMPVISTAGAGETDSPGARQRAVLTEIRRLMLGYAFDARRVEAFIQAEKAGEVPDGDRATAELEAEILSIFADSATLSRRHPEGMIEGGRLSAFEYLSTYLRHLDAAAEGLPAAFLAALARALGHYGVSSLARSPALEEGLFRLLVAHRRAAYQVPAVLALLERSLRRSDRPAEADGEAQRRDLLDRLIAAAQGREPALYDLAREVRYRCFDRPLLLAVHEQAQAAAETDLVRLASRLDAAERTARIGALVGCTQPLHRLLSERFATAGPELSSALLEIMLRRYYRLHPLSAVREILCGELRFIQGDYEHRGVRVRVLATHAPYEHLRQTFAALTRQIAETPRDGRELAIDLYVWSQWRQWRQASAETLAADAVAAELSALLASHGFPPGLRRVAVSLSGPQGFEHFTYRPTEGTPGYTEDRLQRGLHPMVAQRLELWRLLNFRLERLPAPEGVFLFLGVAAENPRDARLFALAEVRDLTPLGDSADRTVQLPELEHTLLEALAGIRHFQARRTAGERLLWNRVLLNIWPPVDLPPAELHGLLQRLAPLGEGLGLEKVVVRFRIPQAAGGETQDRVLEISDPGESGMRLRFRKPSTAPLKPLREYAQKVVELRRRGLLYPYELIKRLAAPRQAAPTDLPPGDFTEYDLAPGDPSRLVPVARPYGGNTANIVLGVIRSYTERYPEGMARVLLIGDPSHSMGSLAEPECRRILGALDLASTLGVPVEWFAVSSGARIAMDSGTENMDWIARVLRRIVTFTDQGGEINLVVAAINAGAQPYWNAAATMLMHTRGILIMTPEGTMVLTGKQALDYSGGVSAEDNQGIGGYERIMGPNGEAQYFARDVAEACRLLLAHYEHTYKAPGELFPRPAASRDPRQRDVRAFPHGGAFETVGDVFSEATNPGRKRPFEIRRVMSAVVDQDLVPLERWYGMRGAEIAVVWEAHLGGYPVCLLGFESKPLPRLEPRPVDGPRQWTGSTLFPAAAKKVARAIHAASGNRPLVVLANLSGFDGSPESMRLAQLEHGAEIGRAIVEFRGPIVLCVVSRFHGGAFVVFSQALNDNLEVAALEGSHASVLGGTTAAAMVFGREVDRRAWEDPRLAGFTGDRATAVEGEKAPLFAAVRAEKLGEVAAELDRIHDISRAQEKGSVHHVLPPERLRPYLIEAVERGMAKSLRTGL